MKDLYIFKWANGKEEEPLQAYSAKQALYVLVQRYEKKRPGFNKFEILNAFRNGDLTYKVDIPYHQLKKSISEPVTQPPKKPEGYQQMSFKDFLEK